MGIEHPMTRTDVAAVEVGEDWVVYDPATGAASVLNPSAATVWAMLDGATTVAEIARGIASVHGIDAGAVTEQIRALVSELADQGLLVDHGRSDAGS